MLILMNKINSKKKFANNVFNHDIYNEFKIKYYIYIHTPIKIKLKIIIFYLHNIPNK